MFFCTKPMSAGRRLQDNVWGFPSLTLYANNKSLIILKPFFNLTENFIG